MAHTLLLADDSVTIRRVIELTFADEDIRVIAVGDGRSAIERVETERPDIVLADIAMPEKDGYEVAAFIKSSPTLAHIPVLLLTGAFEPIDEGRARTVGCDGVLVKPFEPQMVISRVKDLIAGNRAASAARANSGHPAQPSSGAHAASHGGTAADQRSGEPYSEPAPSSEAYFERLDAAFAALDASGDAARHRPAAHTEPVDARAPEGPPVSTLGAELTGWEPVALELNVPGAPGSRPDERPHPERPGNMQAPTSSPAPASPAVAPGAVSLADAFAALLAAERGVPMEAPAARAVAQGDTLLDLVTRRVIERLADRTMRDAVLEVAERLVREEIDRIKNAAQTK